MIGRTNHQIITKDGKPEFVVVPYSEYIELFGDSAEATIPHEVVGFHVVYGMSMIKAWRKHLKITQRDMAERMGITQSAYSQIESADRPQKATLDKVASALGIPVEQLTE